MQGLELRVIREMKRGKMIEKTQKVTNLRASLEYLENGKVSERYKYLDMTDDKQIRNLYNYNGNKIDF